LTCSGFKPEPLITEYFKLVNSLRNCDKNADESWDTHLHGMDGVLFPLVQRMGSRWCYRASAFHFLNSQGGRVSKYSCSV